MEEGQVGEVEGCEEEIVEEEEGMGERVTVTLRPPRGREST